MIYIIVFLIVIVVYLLYKSYNYREHFIDKNTIQNISKERNVILLGDSILKNNSYVRQKNSIEYILRQKTNATIYCFAEDGATIRDVYKQIEAIPLALNNEKNVVFLSVGGNDILNSTNKIKNDTNIDAMFQHYKNLLSTLQLKLNKCKIVVLNLYIPPNINKLKKNGTTNDMIQEWSHILHDYIYNKLQSRNVELIDLNSLLYKPIDFVSDYEPSEVGGSKIVAAMLHKL